MLGLVALVGPQPLPVDPPRRTFAIAGLVGIFTLALVWNGWLLLAGRGLFLDRAAYTRAIVTVAMGDLPAGMDPDKVKLLDRTVTRLREVLAEFGSPLQDSLAQDAVQPVHQDLIDKVRQDLLDQQAGK